MHVCELPRSSNFRSSLCCAPAGEPFSIIPHTIGILLSHAMVYYYYVFISFQRYFLLILSNWIRQNLFQYRVHKCVSWGVWASQTCYVRVSDGGCGINVFSIGKIRLYRRNLSEFWTNNKWFWCYLRFCRESVLFNSHGHWWTISVVQ